MKRYVIGFLFDGAGYVALIKKARPSWQAGKLNGVGGVCNMGEDPKWTMVRKFEQEAGVLIDYDKWRVFAVLRGTDEEGEDFELNCLTCRRPANLKSQPDEQVSWYSTFIAGDPTLLPFLSWLIPMADDPTGKSLFATVVNVWN